MTLESGAPRQGGLWGGLWGGFGAIFVEIPLVA